ncbi:MAG: hypothetical protein CMG13_02805 [Candidatus Marinimicrobia bacterium]|nr:hypothetical protein [Candidatus Neomarinimicrobiota bacterium]
MLSILKNPTFLLFFLGNIISLLGFGFNLIAVTWLVLEKTGSEIVLGKVIAAATIPGLFIAFFTGYIIDKSNRKWLMVALDVFRIFVIGAFLIVVEFSAFNITHLFLVTFFMGIGNSLFWSTSQAFTQEIVSEKEYFNANKLLSASFQIGSILGAGIGGIIVHIYDPFVALWINVGTYLISGILISFAPYKYHRKERVSKNFFKSFFIGFTYLKDRKDIATISMTTILSDVAIWGSLSVLTITISNEIFNKGAWGYGLLDGLYGIGALLSVVTVGVLSSYLNRKNILIYAYIIGFISLYLSSIMPNIYLASVFFFILGININSSRIITRTIVMENIENRIMGRVQTLLGIYTRIMVVISSLATGYLIEGFTINTAVIFACSHYFLAMLGVYVVSKVWKRSGKYLLNKDNLN